MLANLSYMWKMPPSLVEELPASDIYIMKHLDLRGGEPVIDDPAEAMRRLAPT